MVLKTVCSAIQWRRHQFLLSVQVGMQVQVNLSFLSDGWERLPLDLGMIGRVVFVCVPGVGVAIPKDDGSFLHALVLYGNLRLLEF